MINREALRTDNGKIFCLEVADEMFTCGFENQIYKVFRLLSQATQVILLSATMPEDVLRHAKKFVRGPVRIIAKRDSSLEGIKQFYVLVGMEE